MPSCPGVGAGGSTGCTAVVRGTVVEVKVGIACVVGEVGVGVTVGVAGVGVTTGISTDTALVTKRTTDFTLVWTDDVDRSTEVRVDDGVGSKTMGVVGA